MLLDEKEKVDEMEFVGFIDVDGVLLPLFEADYGKIILTPQEHMGKVDEFVIDTKYRYMIIHEDN